MKNVVFVENVQVRMKN